MTSARAVALGFVIVGAIGTIANRADADETLECATAYEKTQRLQQRSELVASLAEAERCARPTCPELLRGECVRWSQEIRNKLPKLVVHVRDGEGCAGTDAKIAVSGASRKEGDALMLDPGKHEISVSDPASSRSKTQMIDFAPGERREIDVDFAPEGAVCGGGPSTSKPLWKRFSTVTLVLGGVGGGLLLGGATLGVIGAVKRSDLDECKPNCPQDRIDGVRPFFVAGDVIAGFGVLALGAAVITYFAEDAKPASASASRPRLVVGAGGVGATF